jgi:hypothetical protein
MAYREHGMWEILEVLKKLHEGKSVRVTSRLTGRDRKTVKRYQSAATEVGWVCGLHEPDEALAGEVLSFLRPGPKGDEPSETEQQLELHRSRIEAWLKRDDLYKRGLQLTKVHKLLQRDGVAVSYSALYRYAVRHLGFSEKSLTVRMDDVSPGEVAEVDFGRLGLVPDAETGKSRVLHALIVTLSLSESLSESPSLAPFDLNNCINDICYSFQQQTITTPLCADPSYNSAKNAPSAALTGGAIVWPLSNSTKSTL